MIRIERLVIVNPACSIAQHSVTMVVMDSSCISVCLKRSSVDSIYGEKGREGVSERERERERELLLAVHPHVLYICV